MAGWTWKAFVVGAAFPLVYFLWWHATRAFGMEWHNSWNIPGFLFLAGSHPWSWPALEYQIALNQFLGQSLRKAVQEFSVIGGFGLNVALACWVLVRVRRITMR